MPWADSSKVRALTGITPELIPDSRLSAIISQSDSKIRSDTLVYYFDVCPIAHQTSTAIQLQPNVIVGDSNFDKTVNHLDLKIYAVSRNPAGLQIKTLLSISAFDPLSNIITFPSSLPSAEFFSLECYLNPLNFPISTLCEASTYLTASKCLRVLGLQEPLASAYECLSSNLTRRVFASFI